MNYESRVNTTVYELTCKNGEVHNIISPNDYGYDTYEADVEHYDTPEEAIDDFLADNKEFTFSCNDLPNGAKSLVATSPMMTGVYSSQYGLSFLKASTDDQLQVFKAGEMPQYQVVKILEVYEIVEKQYNVEDYLNKFRA